MQFDLWLRTMAGSKDLPSIESFFAAVPAAAASTSSPVLTRVTSREEVELSSTDDEALIRASDLLVNKKKRRVQLRPTILPYLPGSVRVEQVINEFTYILYDLGCELVRASCRPEDYYRALHEDEVDGDSAFLNYSRKYNLHDVFQFHETSKRLNTWDKMLEDMDWYGVYAEYWPTRIRAAILDPPKDGSNRWFMPDCGHCASVPCWWYKYVFLQYLSRELQAPDLEMKRAMDELNLKHSMKLYEKAADRVDVMANKLQETQAIFNDAERKANRLATRIYTLRTSLAGYPTTL